MNKDYIFRKGYVDTILPFVGKSIIKVLVGQRRVGKSFLLYQLMELIQKQDDSMNIIYIDKEQYEFEFIKTDKELMAYISEKEKANCKNAVFIDEIQDIEGFEKVLRHFSSHTNFDMYCTGSNANLLSGELATYLSGRYIEFPVYGLSFEEFLEFNNLENSNESLRKYMRYGGLPFIRNLQQNDEVLTEYLRSIFNTILFKDIVSRFQIRNTYFLENLVRYLANNVGNIISANKISEYLKSQQLKISPQLVLNYLHFLSQAFLIYNVKRTEITGKKVFEINEKCYFADWGLANAIIGFKSIDIGKVIENVVFLHLKIRGYEVFVGKLGDKEIDFVAEKNGVKVYFQVCYLISGEQVIEREFGNLLKINDNYSKYVISLDEFAPQNMQGVKHIHLKDFLLMKEY